MDPLTLLDDVPASRLCQLFTDPATEFVSYLLTLVKKKVVSKKQKAKTVKSTIEGRRAEEERCQPRRLEPEQPANLPLSESAILGRGDAVASVFVDYVLGIRSSKTHNP